MQDLTGPSNHYHFHTAPGVTHDAEALIRYAASPAAAGKAQKTALNPALCPWLHPCQHAVQL
jgi:hypothetical protein